MTINEKLREISEKFDEKFVGKDVTNSEAWTLEGRAVWKVKDFILTSSHELLEEVAKEIEWLKEPNQAVSEYYSGFNSALNSATEIIRRSIQK